MLFLAAENAALPHGKVGGLGDVIRDLPAALAARNWDVTVATPAYGMFAQLPGARPCAELDVEFSGALRRVTLVELPRGGNGVRQLALEHALFSPRGPGRIYTDVADEGPFATDATKFAFFCAAAAAALSRGTLSPPDIVHLHDWQTGLYLLLRAFAPEHSALKSIRTVFTIHNLAMQGIRPLDGHASALHAWFPDLDYEPEIVTDPRWTDCVNPMAVAIRLADAVNTVSPTYAREILEPSDPARGYSGGEGLERDVVAVNAAGRFSGIINGCTYPAQSRRRPSWRRVLGTMRAVLTQWIAGEPSLSSAHYLADKRIATLTDDPPRVLLTSIGRITAQKCRLFREPTETAASALEAILAVLGRDGLFVMVGSGEPQYERFMRSIAGRHDNFLFLNGYSDALADALYARGDLFLMPSSFEPCGISQMRAMRAGQLCVVHGVGGLKDTVADGVTGFVFAAHTPPEQANLFVAKVRSALELRSSAPDRWRRMQNAAAAVRFSWPASAAAYERKLYGHAAARH